VVAYSDASGNQHVTTGYGPFGEVPNFYSARYEYTGQLNIPELSLFDFKARAYDPTLGRFLSADPAGYASDVNSYAYVGNDPVNGTDPSGMAEPQPAKLKSGDGNGGPPCWCYGSGGYGTSGASGWIPYIPPCGGAAGGWDYAAYPDNCPIPGDTVTLNPSGGGVQGGHVGIGTGSTGGGIQLSVSLERHYTSSDFCTALFEAGVFTKQLGQHFEKFGISVASAGMAEVVVVGGPADPLAAPGVVATDLGGETALSGGAGVAIGDAAILATTRHAEGFFGDFLKDAVVDPLPLPEATKAALEDALGDPEEPAGPSC
jgi:RHS repeat-associated protein